MATMTHHNRRRSRTWLSLSAWKLLCSIYDNEIVEVETTDPVQRRAARTLIRHHLATSELDPSDWDHDDIVLPPQVVLGLTAAGDEYVQNRRRNL
jgi:hypothetical protein